MRTVCVRLEPGRSCTLPFYKTQYHGDGSNDGGRDADRQVKIDAALIRFPGIADPQTAHERREQEQTARDPGHPDVGEDRDNGRARQGRSNRT